MYIAKKSLLAAALALGAMASAHADSFASALLDINHFRLLHSGGGAYSTADFTTLTGTNDAHATGELNGVFANGAQSFGILSGTNPDVPHQCVGACFPKVENDFTPFLFPPPGPGTFGYADQRLTGSSISIAGSPADAHANTRADAALMMNGTASGNSDVGTSTTFAFVLGASDTMTVAFDGTPFSQAWVSAGSGPTTNANARLSWSMQIVNLTTGGTVFAYAPIELNALSNVSRTDGAPGTTTYNPGTAFFSATTPLLAAGNTYQITIQHNTLANALQAVPEPASLAIFGLGLLGLSAFTRRRQS
ncbi:MAG TPA: PEP-CTERM sorting domain-containing protein [Telluria sp.]|nr:PEP-CTERM sorting domain-containing protein [Telluria sp.]